MNKLTISTDSTADLTPELYKEYEISIMPIGVVIGDKQYQDGVDVTPEDVYNAVEKLGVSPKTQAPSQADYEDFFKKVMQPGVDHLHISLSSQLSLSNDSANKAAAAMKNVYVVDSKVLSSATGILVIKAREMSRAGMSTKEVVAKCEELVKRLRCTFVIDNLKYMHKGGRCGGFKFMMANVLKIHPMLQMTPEGKLVAGEKFKGNYAGVCKKYVAKVLEDYPNADKSLILVTHTAMEPEIEKQVMDDVKAAGFKRILNTTAGSVITTHCGRNCIGILFLDGENN
jgi:DegV family protein with EDD domain